MSTEATSTSVAKVIEIIAVSPNSFDEAIKQGLSRANKTLGGISGAWIKEQSMECKDGVVTLYKVIMKVTFVVGH